MNALMLAVLLAATGFKAHGFSLPDGAVKVDENRYRLPQAWDETLRWYRTVYPPAKFPRHTLRSQTPVKAIHIDNPRGDEWDGANLYEAARGEVRIYVLPSSKTSDGGRPATKAK